jgi:predicted Na+-dependent transporter
MKWHKFFRRELLVTVPLSGLLMPWLYYHVLSASFSPGYRIGLMLTAIAPSGIMMLVLSRFVQNKDYNLIMSNFLFTTFGSIIYVPFMVRWLVGTTIQMNITHLFFQTAPLILIPYAASEITKKIISDNVATIIKRRTETVMSVLVFLAIAVSISGTAQELVWDQIHIKLGVLVLSIFFLQGGLAYLAGLILSDEATRNTLTMIASSRNLMLMLGIAIINFPPIVGVPCVLGIILQNITSMVWIWLFRK